MTPICSTGEPTNESNNHWRHLRHWQMQSMVSLCSNAITNNIDTPNWRHRWLHRRLQPPNPNPSYFHRFHPPTTTDDSDISFAWFNIFSESNRVLWPCPASILAMPPMNCPAPQLHFWRPCRIFNSFFDLDININDFGPVVQFIILFNFSIRYSRDHFRLNINMPRH